MDAARAARSVISTILLGCLLLGGSVWAQRAPPGGGLAPPTHLNGAFACGKDAGAILQPLSALPGLAGRDLNQSVSSSLQMTNDMCRSSCAAQGLPFAGTQSGSFCFCGNTALTLGAATCNAPCGGNRTEVCGGALANSVSFSGALGNPLFVPPPPANGGQCVINIVGPGYRHFEIQTWELQGAAVAGNGKTYTMHWVSTGNGGLETEAVTTNAAGFHSQMSIRLWRIKSSATVLYSTIQVAGGPLVFNWANTLNQGGGVFESASQWLNGVAQAPAFLEGRSYPYPYQHSIAPPIGPMLVDVSTLSVQPPNKYGYAQPDNAAGSINCTWSMVL